ncbi:hypothetical protein FNV43_RR02318 [Rhamnella rubrinervis]|uniref:Uncharacterized protein n=1 Tax=Rhamnella rubrinervis TaxID=2594499 RepID=A0A8K0HS27_9ROSA|nr:hypothetical protein FNV43_RR02318 [Rhamnella rubrinervis]
MESKQIPFRAIGQRSIASIFHSRSSNPFKVSKGGSQGEGSEKGSGLSLSDFLNRKLHQTSEPPKIVKGKSRPFSSLLGLRELSECKDGKIGAKKGEEEDTNSFIDKVIFEQFKRTGTEKEECVGSSSIGEAENCNIADVRGSRKRKNIEGDNDKYVTRKHFAILGGDLKAKQRRREKSFDCTEKQPLYDHYANGRGWWESGMEGIDDEEVGLTEAWEGVGSTTMGGVIDWH